LTSEATHSILQRDLSLPFFDFAMSDQTYDPRYLAYFECINRQRFFEAHAVLESLWLRQRQAPNGAFYKGLIQLAGAFVHWQKNRLGPAVALLGLAQANLGKYPATHEGLNVTGVLAMAADVLRQLTTATPGVCPPLPSALPPMRLQMQSPTRLRGNCECVTEE
jgi:predicted metal-dependent hydrolase